MRVFARLLSVFTLLLFPIGGCTEVTTPTTAPLTLTVTAWDPEAESQARLQDVQLCELDSTTRCAMTDSRGEATIQMPIGEETSFTLTKEKYTSWLVAIVMPANGLEIPWATGLVRVDEFDRVNSQTPMIGRGRVAFQLEPQFAGATAELVGATGKEYYEDEGGRWRLDLTETTSRGRGGFVEVGPGEWRVTFGGTGEQCRPGLGWPGDTENSVRFEVREGYASHSTMNCPRPPTVQLHVTVNEAVEGLGDPFTGPLLEGAEVCETGDTSNCATTDADGEARLLLRANEEISYTVTKGDEYVPFLGARLTGDGPGFSRSAFVVSDAQMADLAEDLGIEYPLTGGIVALRAYPLMAGVTYDLLDGTAKGYYNDEAGTPTLGLAATTANGGGGFLEVSPGEYQIDFGGTATTCNVGAAWPVEDAENQIRVPVKVGHITYGSMSECDEP